MFKVFGDRTGKVFGGKGRKLSWLLVSLGGSLPLSLLNIILSLKRKSKKEKDGLEIRKNYKSKRSHCPARLL